MLNKFLVALVSVAISSAAFAGELDGDKGVANGKGLKETVVFRVDTRDNSVSVLTTKEIPMNKEQAQKMVQSANFKPVAKENLRTELDSAAGSSSWYYCYPGYGYGYPGYGYGYGYSSYYYAYGNYYYPYYNYGYGYYNYAYYGGGYGYWR